MEDAMIPITRETYDVSRDVDEIFPDEFKKYVADNIYVAKRWLVDDDDNDEWAFGFEHADGVNWVEYRHAVDEVIRSMETTYLLQCGSLIQFWRAEEVNTTAGERPSLLTTFNQPFLLTIQFSKDREELVVNSVDKLCRYRTKMHDVIVNGDGTGGPVGRVFRNNKMEFTLNVSYYPDKEYPQHDIALSCNIKSSAVLPWRDYDGRVVGAIEFVLEYWELYFLSSVLDIYPLYWEYCIRLCKQASDGFEHTYDLEKDSLISAVFEINEVIGCYERRDVVRCAQTWMLCKHCNSLSTVKRYAEELKATSEYFIDGDDGGSIFLEFQDYYNLKKGEGVVGKAAESSHDLVYCKDVAKFSITEYPLAHFARYFGLSASFAIRLKSNQTGDQVYVLEFFLLPDYVKGKNLMATLVPILEKMRQCFKTFKFASGEEIRDNFSVQVIDANSPDKVEILDLELNLTLGHKNDKAFNFLQNLERFGGQGSSRPSCLQSSIGESSAKETDDLMTIVETSLQDISMEDASIASASTVQCEIRLTIKASYGVDSISFQLSASSGIYELYRQVSHRLQLADGTYDLKYPDDENDLIELTCDEDLQLYISSSTEQENYNLLVFVVPR